jgi:hypothetical protein
MRPARALRAPKGRSARDKADICPWQTAEQSSERLHKLLKIAWLMGVPLLLPHEERMERALAVMGGRVGAPLLQPFPLGRIVQVLPALGFYDPDFRVAPLDDEIRDVVGDAAVGVAVLDTEDRALAVFDEGDDVVAAIEEAREFQFIIVVADDLVEHRFFLARRRPGP